MRQIHRAKLAERYLDKRVNKNSRSGHTGVCWRETCRNIMPTLRWIGNRSSWGTMRNWRDVIAARKAAEEKYFRPRQEKVDAIKKQMKD